MWPIIFPTIPLVDYIKKAYNIHPDAKYIGFFDFGCPVTVIKDQELIKSITVKHFDSFVNHRGFVDPAEEPFFGNNLFSLHDEKWRAMRNLLSPAFTSSKMKGMFKLMSDCAARYADYFVEQSQKKPLEINSKETFTRYTNDVIATCAFGIEVDSMRHPKNDFYIFGRKGTNFDGLRSLKFFMVRSFPRFTKLLNIKIIDDDVEVFFTQIVKDTIAMRDEKGIVRPDMIQLMMETRKNEESGSLNIQEMTAQAFIFFLGGFDTTSTLMCFAAQEVACHPDIQSKLQAEIDEVFEKYNDNPPYEAIQNLAYLDAVLAEALRMYPVAGFLDRVCNREFQLPPALPGKKSVTLKPGDNIWVPVYPMNRDPKIHPNPDVFDPDRFISNGKTPTSAITSLTFGLGPRMCIGNRFALLETKTLFAHILRKCWLKPAKRAIVPIQISNSTIAMTAKGGFWLDIQPRDKYPA
uniref:Cytochrome P450 n=1 Tax=Bracon brevicornis TaxID=1563983 RepID=A0A6V7HM26_9HYME